MPKYEVVPDWIMDNELFEEYMENYPVQPEPDPFWKEPFPESWSAAADPKVKAEPEPAKQSLIGIVGFMWQVFLDDMRFWRQ